MHVAIAISGKPKGYIGISEGCGKIASFAARELKRYLEAISGSKFEVCHIGSSHQIPKGCVIAICPDDIVNDYDSYSLMTKDGSILLCSKSERGLLYAVYELLKLIGCNWALPSELHERVPKLNDIVLPNINLTRKPSFEVRGFVEDPKHVPFDDDEMFMLHMQEVESLIDWMGKMGINSFLPHRVEPERALNIILPMMSARGIEREVGGHIIPSLLPRELFGTNPGLFRMNKNGKRVQDGNLCPSNADALAIVASNAEMIIRSTGSPFLHLWGEDLVAGGWCSCHSCSRMTPQEQYLRVCEAVSRRLREGGLNAEVGYLAYHDTLIPSFTSVNEPLWFVYAPRERCYAHPIDDEQCEINRRYYDALCALYRAFDGRGYIFEYYGDALLFGSLMMPISRTIKKDVRAYLRLGLKRITCLVFGGYSWWAYGANLSALVNALWDADQKWSYEGHFGALYGNYGGAVSSIYERIESAMLPISEHHDAFLCLVGNFEEAVERTKRVERAIYLMNRCHKDALSLWLQMWRDGEEQLAARWFADVELMRMTILLLMLMLHTIDSKSRALCSKSVFEDLRDSSRLMARHLRMGSAAPNRLIRSIMTKLSFRNRHVDKLLLGTWGGVGAPKYLKRLVERAFRAF